MRRKEDGSSSQKSNAQMRPRISVKLSGMSASARLLLSLDISYSVRWKWRQEEGTRREKKSEKKKKCLLCAEQVIESGRLIVRAPPEFSVNPSLT